MYATVYITLMVAELFFIILMWSPYGDPDGAFAPLYNWVKKRLDGFVITMLFVLMILSYYFPGVGFFGLLILLYRVAEKCCGTLENFGDGLLYGWGRYHPDYKTVYDQGCLERTQDGTRAAYSSALGDNEDRRWMAKLADFENSNVHNDIGRVQKKVVLFPKADCDQGNWIIPKIVDTCKIYTPTKNYVGHPCPVGCGPCSLAFAGSVLQDRVRPRGLVTTSLLAKQVDER